MSWRASGLKAWAWQRLSAVMMAVYLIGALWVLLLDPPQSYSQWRGLLGQAPVRVATGLFFLFLLLHTWIGIRDVILDYMKPPALRLPALALIASVLLALGVWVLLILAGIQP